MSEMLDRLAKALYESKGFVRPWEHEVTQEKWKPVMIKYAHAALLALREPTSEMLATFNSYAQCEGYVEEGWRAMIDEVLK